MNATKLAPFKWAKTRERHTAEIDQHCNALESVADNLEDEGLYEATLIRASVHSIREACMGLNNIAFQQESAEGDAAVPPR